MKHFISLKDFDVEEIKSIFKIADEIDAGKYSDSLKNKTAVMFFPTTSLRTRVTFEKGIFQLGGQTILFPPETLDKKEEAQDVFGYLNNWADIIIIRHNNIDLVKKISEHSTVPVINAMTNVNHPCEILSDLYSLSKIRKNFITDKYLFCGAKGNIGLAWKEASDVLGINLEQCCGQGYEIEGLKAHYDINDAIVGKDIICTDSLSKDKLEAFKKCKISKSTMEKANPGSVLNPCPPFFRGEEVSEDVINSHFFVGYEFKKNLLKVQQAIIVFLLNHQ